MVFSSIEFLLGFLPIFLVIYYLTPVKYKNVILFAGSLFFYAYGEPKYVFLLLASMVLNYVYGRIIEPKGKVRKRRKEKKQEIEKRRKRELTRKIHFIVILTLNIAVLALFKWSPDGMGLPLGVSFYTFQVISYLTDVYRGEIKAERSFLKLGTYICMFPQLVAGPIVNYSEVSQTLERPAVNVRQFDSGLKTFVWGLMMKVLVADRLAILWHEIATIGYISISTPLAWMGAFSYSMQIYFDFYGYSLMAIGLGRMLGYSLPVNFKMPYMAKSIREFYRKWHMTLGRWFTKYVYIPMGGSRKGLLRTLRNLLIVWVLTSFWHGGSLNFLLWGMILCFFILLEKIVSTMSERRKMHGERRNVSKKKQNESQDMRQNKQSGICMVLKNAISHCYVLLVIPITWMCFAINKTSDLWTYLGRMFGFVEGMNVNPLVFEEKVSKYGVLLLIAAFLCTPVAERLFTKWKNRLPGMLVLTGLFWLCVWYLITMGNNPFMYFRF